MKKGSMTTLATTFSGIMCVTSLYLLYKIGYERNNNKEIPNIVVNNNPIPYINSLMNPYEPPLTSERYLMPMPIPINVSTNVGAVDTSYRQIGILNATNSTGKVMVLMGRPLFTNRDKWQYYAISDQNNAVKLPISKNGRSGTTEYGCDKLYNGDTIYVEGINETCRVTVYDNDTMKYLPFI